jgi:hypothetical protein
MMKSVLSAAIVSLLALSAAWALPVSPTATLPQLTSNDIVQVGKKYYNKHYKYNKNYYGKKYYKGRYHYGNRYWNHRYNYRPYNWQALGCIVVGPVWYCP